MKLEKRLKGCEVSLDHTITNDDLDENNHLSYLTSIHLLDKSRRKLYAMLGFPVDTLEREHGIQAHIHVTTYKYCTQGFYQQKIKVSSSINYLPKKFTFIIDNTILNEQEEVLVQASFKAYFFDPKKNTFTKIPEDFNKALQKYLIEYLKPS